MNKCEKVKFYIQSLIGNNNFKLDTKIPSENQLADRCHVSRNTVRRAISQMVNDGHLYTIHGVGTFIDTANTKTKNIGVITTYINDYIFPSVISGINDYLYNKSYSIILSETKNNRENERKCLENMLSKDIEGLIIEPTKSALYPGNIEIYEEFIKRKIPILLLHGYFENYDFPYVIMDDVYSGYLATKHLIKNKHRDILGIFKNDDIQGIMRYNGYLKAMNEYKFPITANSIIWFHTDDKDEKPSYVLKSIIEKGKNKPSAIFCYNDQTAYQIIKCLKNNDLKIPGDISIIGHDDSLLSYGLETKFTSISHPKNKLGKIAAESILKLINKEDEKIQIKIKGELVKRNSVINI